MTSVVANHHQESNPGVKIALSPASASLAPPTYPGIQLSGNPSATVEIDLLDATGAPLPQQAAVDLAVAEAPFSGGHAHDNVCPVGTLSWQGAPASFRLCPSRLLRASRKKIKRNIPGTRGPNLTYDFQL